MSLVLADRVKVRSQTVGTGTFTLGNPVAGFQNFEIVGDGNETYYTIINSNGQWEIGRGTYFSGVTKTLTRDTVLDSSTGGSVVDFSSGGKIVFCSYPASVATAVVSGGGLASDSFKTIAVSGQTDVVADSSTDTLTLAAGSNITITTDAVTDTITIASSGGAANTGDIAFSGNILYNGVSYDQSIYIAPGGESTSYIQVPGNSESDTTAVRISNASATGRVEISANGYNTYFEADGSVQQNNSFTRTTTPVVNIGAGTVVWTGLFDYISSAKLVIQVECSETGDDTGWHVQTCEAIIASRGYAAGGAGVGDPVMTVYGIVHTSTVPLVTFTVRRNPTTKQIEVVGTLTAAAGGDADLRIHSVEMSTRD